MPIKPPRRPLGALAIFLMTAEEKISQQLYKRLLNLQDEFDIRDWAEALTNLDPTGVQTLMNDLPSVGSGDMAAWVDTFREILRQSAHIALSEWAKNKDELFAPYGRPEPVEVANAPEFANLTQQVELPEWAKPRTDKLNLTIAFNVTDENAVKWAARRAGELVTAIDDQTRQGIRQIIHESLAQGISPEKTARRIRNVVGLHPRWASAVNKYESQQVARLIREGLTPDNAAAKAAELASKYRNKLVRKRATMIARTEIMTAENKGRELGWTALGSAGLIDPVSEKEWITAPMGSSYGAPCDHCSEMRGVRVRYNQAFPNGLWMPPAHPHCRCTAKLVPPTRGLSEVELTDGSPTEG